MSNGYQYPYPQGVPNINEDRASRRSSMQPQGVVAPNIDEYRTSRRSSMQPQGLVVPSVNEDRASRSSSRTSYSQQSSWPSSSKSSSRTFSATPSSSYSPASSYRSSGQRPNDRPQPSAVTAGIQCPVPSPAYSVSSFQASIVDPRGADDFGRTSSNLTVSPSPGQRYPTQYQQPAYANTPPTSPPSKGLKRLLGSLGSQRRSEASTGGYQAGSPSLSRGGRPAADRGGRDSVPSSRRESKPQVLNVGSCYQAGPLSEEVSFGKPGENEAYQMFGQGWRDTNSPSAKEDEGYWSYRASNKRRGGGSSY